MTYLAALVAVAAVSFGLLIGFLCIALGHARQENANLRAALHDANAEAARLRGGTVVSFAELRRESVLRQNWREQ